MKRIKKILKHLWVSLFLTYGLSAQIQTINPTDLISTGPGKINSNFSYLNANKPTFFTGAGAPGNITGSSLGSIYYDTTNDIQYSCYAASGNCTAVASGNWQSSATGTVSSVGMTVPSILSISGSPVTGSGTLAVTLTTQSANKVFAGPTSGGVATPTFRSLVKADQVSTTMYTDQTNTLTGEIVTLASTTSLAGFSLTPGVAPTSPNPGDMWITGKYLFYQDNEGVPATQKVAVFSDKDAASGYAGLTASTKLNLSEMQQVMAVTDLTSYSSTSGTGAVAILATISGPTNGQVLSWNGTTWVNAAPTLSATHALLSLTHSDTQASAAVAGGTIYASSTTPSLWTQLAGNMTTTKMFLTQTGTGVASAAPAWGTIAGGDLPATAVQTNQANTYTAGAQSFAAAASLLLPNSAGAAPTASGSVAYDSTANAYAFGVNGFDFHVAFYDKAQTFTVSPTFSAGLSGTTINATTGFQISGGATLGLYLRGNGTNFVASTVAAAGAGGCTNQFPRTLNDNAAPTCNSVAGTDFATQSANLVFSGPTSGGAAAPTFRSLVAADLPATAQTAIGNATANFVWAGPTSGSATTPTFRALVSLDLPAAFISLIANEAATGTTLHFLAKTTGAPSTAIIPAISDTGGIIGVVVGGAGKTGNAQIAVTGQADCQFDGATTAGHYAGISASQSGECTDAGASFPSSGQVVGRVLSTNAGAGVYTVQLFGPEDHPATGSGSGTVTSFSAGTLSPLFTTSVATATSTPALSFTLSTQSANLIFAGPTTGAAAAPTFRSVVKADQVSTTMYTDQANTITAGKLTTLATGTGGAGFNLPSGTAPTSPAVGDLWSTGGGIFFDSSSGVIQLGATTTSATSFSGADIGAQVNNAFASFAAGQCGTVTIPAGSYTFSTTIFVPSGCYLQGAGSGGADGTTAGTTLIYSGSGATSAIVLGTANDTPTSNAGVSNLLIKSTAVACSDGSGVGFLRWNPGAGGANRWQCAILTPQTPYTVTAASNATPIQITTSASNTIVTGNSVEIMGVQGNTAANGEWIVTGIDGTHFTLNGSVGNGTFNAASQSTAQIVTYSAATAHLAAIQIGPRDLSSSSAGTNLLVRDVNIASSGGSAQGDFHAGVLMTGAERSYIENVYVFGADDGISVGYGSQASTLIHSQLRFNKRSGLHSWGRNYNVFSPEFESNSWIGHGGVYGTGAAVLISPEADTFLNGGSDFTIRLQYGYFEANSLDIFSPDPTTPANGSILSTGITTNIGQAISTVQGTFKDMRIQGCSDSIDAAKFFVTADGNVFEDCTFAATSVVNLGGILFNTNFDARQFATYYPNTTNGISSVVTTDTINVVTTGLTTRTCAGGNCDALFELSLAATSSGNWNDSPRHSFQSVGWTGSASRTNQFSLYATANSGGTGNGWFEIDGRNNFGSPGINNSHGLAPSNIALLRMGPGSGAGSAFALVPTIQASPQTLTATPNANAGTGATCALTANSSNNSGQVTLVTGSAAWSSGVQCTIAYSASLGGFPVIIPASATTAGASVTRQVYVGGGAQNAANFTINFGVADSGATTYVWNWTVVGVGVDNSTGL